MYRSFIVIVDARLITFSYYELKDQLRAGPYILKGTGTMQRRIDFAKQYRPEVILFTIPRLQRKCKSLRQVKFGHNYLGPQYCIVHLPKCGDPSSKVNISKGYIEYCAEREMRVSETPPPHLLPPAPIGYEMRGRFDLTLCPDTRDVSKANKWSFALKDGKDVSHIHRVLTIKTDLLQTTLGDLASIYQRQDDASHTDRLAKIYVRRIHLWNIFDWRAFTTIASASLQELHLGVVYDSRGGVTFEDLPELIGAIRSDLPNLKSLHLSMNGVETAERECLRFLHDLILEERGGLREVRIFTAETSGALFGATRCLGQICAPGVASIVIGPDDPHDSSYGGQQRREDRDHKRLPMQLRS